MSLSICLVQSVTMPWCLTLTVKSIKMTNIFMGRAVLLFPPIRHFSISALLYGRCCLTRCKGRYCHGDVFNWGVITLARTWRERQTQYLSHYNHCNWGILKPSTTSEYNMDVLFVNVIYLINYLFTVTPRSYPLISLTRRYMTDTTCHGCTKVTDNSVFPACNITLWPCLCNMERSTVRKQAERWF